MHGTLRLLTLAALGVAWSTAAGAKGLCLNSPTGAGYTLVLPKAKPKAGQVVPAIGYAKHGGPTTGMSGNILTSTDGHRFAISVVGGNVALSSGPSVVGADVGYVYNVLFNQADGKLDIGDTGSGFVDAGSMTFTVIDCANAPAIP